MPKRTNKTKAYNLCLWTDASYKVKHKQCHVAGLAYLVPIEMDEISEVNLIMHFSKRIKRLVNSTFEVELIAVKVLLQRVLKRIPSLLKMFKIPELVLFCDNRPVIESLRSGNCDDGFAYPDLLLVRQHLSRFQITPKWIESEKQKADVGTKLILEKTRGC